VGCLTSKSDILSLNCILCADQKDAMETTIGGDDDYDIKLRLVGKR